MKYEKGYGKDDMYMKGMSGKGRLADGKHASPVEHCDPFAAQKAMNKGIQRLPHDSRGNPSQAFDYKY